MKTPIVTTAYGLVSGIEKNGCHAYLGIPFARKPIGDLAFRHPLPPEVRQGIYHADHGRTNPIQAKGAFSVGNNSQDCLYLNVYVPENAEGPLPVMVWIYGGAFAAGGTGRDDPKKELLCYEGFTYARETKTILVTFNYRLNLYGFLNLHALSDRFDAHCGLYDQMAALRYVRENIAAFGGDPENVTVFGQSAGAASIIALMSMPEADDLFDKAIVQSLPGNFFLTPEESLGYTEAYLRTLGIDKEHVEKVLQLRDGQVRHANKLLATWVMAGMGDIRCAFSPTIDGETIKAHPKKACIRRHIPLLIGCTKEEGNTFSLPVPAAFRPFSAWWCHVPVIRGQEHFSARLRDALTEQIFAGPSREIAERWQGPVWSYLYDYVGPTHEKTGFGCSHASELPILFAADLLREGMPESEGYEVGRRMRVIWSRFAYEGSCSWEEKTTYRIGEE